ncbi:MAG: hypothetical protein RL223_711 [Pseudomonadota bacterium]|jgi:MSHA biogenesis protein MshJ
MSPDHAPPELTLTARAEDLPPPVSGDTTAALTGGTLATPRTRGPSGPGTLSGARRGLGTGGSAAATSGPAPGALAGAPPSPTGNAAPRPLSAGSRPGTATARSAAGDTMPASSPGSAGGAPGTAAPGGAGNAVPPAAVAAAATRLELPPGLQRLMRQFDARPLRERVLMAVAGMAVCGALTDALWLRPTLQRWQQARTELSEAQTLESRLLGDLRQLADHNARRQRMDADELAGWQARVRDGEHELLRYERALVSPTQMPRLLESMLAARGQLRLRELQTMAPVDLSQPDAVARAAAAASAPLGSPAAAAARLAAAQAATRPAPAAAPSAREATNGAGPQLLDGLGERLLGARPAAGAASAGAAAGAAPDRAAAAAPALYRHGVELVVEGPFGDLLGWLRALEQMPQRVLWGELSLDASRYPTNVLTLRVYTLSRDRNWMEI